MISTKVLLFTMRCSNQSIIIVGVLYIGGVVASSQKYIEYTFSGNCSAFTVPDQVNQLNVKLVGASGGTSQYTNTGYGSSVTATINVNAGEVYYFCVGGAGGNNPSGTYSPSVGGWNGGGDGETSSTSGQYGYGGGGASDIRTSINSLSSRIIVAGGGGGAGVVQSTGLYYSSGGYGGCPSGTEGSSAANGQSNSGGDGGTVSGGGAGGYYPSSNSGSSGTQGNGGDAGAGTSGGGGGGGYYGGGGGSNNGGGGGSSYYTNSILTNGNCDYPSYHSGDGYIQLTYNPYTVYNDRYEYTGSAVTFDVPSDVTDLFIQAYGAAGGNSTQGQGGLGGYIAVNLTIPSTGFETLSIAVGGSGGFNGGGSSGCASAGVGGGASTVYASSYDLVVAGGGGGAGYDVNCTECLFDSINGGMGGSWNGANASGSADPMSNVSYGGYGGYHSYGGNGGYYPPNHYGVQGTSGLGGSAASGGTCGGGGGAGYFGGGGGANTGGGGGSSGALTTPVTGLTVVIDSYQEGVNGGNGYVIISYVSSLAVTDDDSSSNSNDDHPDGANGPVIIGSIVVVIVFLCGLCVCLYFWRARKTRMEAALLDSQLQQSSSIEPSAPHVVSSPYEPPESSYYTAKSSAISGPSAPPLYATAEVHSGEARLSEYAGSPAVAVRIDDNHPL